MTAVLDFLAEMRRWSIAAVPVVVLVGKSFGFDWTEELLTTTSDQVLVAAMGFVAALSKAAELRERRLPPAAPEPKPEPPA